MSVHYATHEPTRSHTERGDHKEHAKDSADRPRAEIFAEEHGIDRHRSAVTEAEEDRPGEESRSSMGLNEEGDHDGLQSEESRDCPFRTDPVRQESIGDFSYHAANRHGGRDLSRRSSRQANISHMVNTMQ